MLFKPVSLTLVSANEENKADNAIFRLHYKSRQLSMHFITFLQDNLDQNTVTY